MLLINKIYHTNLDSHKLKHIDERVIHILGNQSPLEPFIEKTALKLINEAHEYMSIQFGYKIIDPSYMVINSGNIFVSNDVTFECNNIIASQLGNIEGLIIFTATLGRKFDEWFKGLFNAGEPLDGYIADLIGSVSVEAAIDILEEKIYDDLRDDNLKCTNRYSPGYCDWNVSEQKKLFSLLPQNFCDIELTESSLMTPIKSVSGIIGYGKAVIKKEYTCKICTQENCYMNKMKVI